MILDDLKQRLTMAGDRAGFLRSAGMNVVLPAMRENIALGGRPPFAPLAPSTIARKRAKGNWGPILVDTGRMLGSLFPGKAGNVMDVDGAAGTGEFGTEISYAAYHQSGTPKMPRRPFAVLQEKDVQALAELAATWCVGTAGEVSGPPSPSVSPSAGGGIIGSLGRR
jgi:phage gpG-like protein